jgi:pantetheine-phosphate adenylyltransferase
MAEAVESPDTHTDAEPLMPQSNTAIFPGMFDPLTYGHLDIIARASLLYERLIVAIGVNPLKQEVFTPREREEMLAAHTADLPNVVIETYDGLTVEYARRVGARVILRGIRDTVDLHDELEIATANLIMGDVETVFLMTGPQHVLTSSALIKQIVEIGKYDPQHLARLVPLDVARRLEERLRRNA